MLQQKSTSAGINTTTTQEPRGVLAGMVTASTRAVTVAPRALIARPRRQPGPRLLHHCRAIAVWARENAVKTPRAERFISASGLPWKASRRAAAVGARKTMAPE